MADSEFSFAKDSVSQVITLSSGILALSLTFAKDFTTTASHGDLLLLESSWVAFLLSIIFGVWSLLAITGLVGIQASSTNSWWLRFPWILELVTFAAGLALFTTFGFEAI